jgi:F-type H+-transporting ATPase subunit b
MLKEAKDIKDKIISDAREQAKAEAARIIDDTQITIENQKMAAVTDLKNQVGNMVLEVAAKVLRRELNNTGAQENYIRELTKEVKLN